MPPSKHRTFSLDELAFFVVQRNWKAIVARFGDESNIRDAIILADDEGGLGFLHWEAGSPGELGTWVLTDRGKIWVGPRALARGERWAPEIKT